jgi:hypothetical protein
MKVHEGFTTQDYKVDQGWLRVFCAPLPDGSCGLLLFQHHYKACNDCFDHLEEANIGLLTGGSYEHAMNRIALGGEQAPIPAAYRRLARLLANGSLLDGLKDTLSERGLLRAVAYSDSPKPHDTRLAMFDRAGFRVVTRNDKQVRILDL